MIGGEYNNSVFIKADIMEGFSDTADLVVDVAESYVVKSPWMTGCPEKSSASFARLGESSNPVGLKPWFASQRRSRPDPQPTSSMVAPGGNLFANGVRNGDGSSGAVASKYSLWLFS